MTIEVYLMIQDKGSYERADHLSSMKIGQNLVYDGAEYFVRNITSGFHKVYTDIFVINIFISRKP